MAYGKEGREGKATETHRGECSYSATPLLSEQLHWGTPSKLTCADGARRHRKAFPGDGTAKSCGAPQCFTMQEGCVCVCVREERHQWPRTGCPQARVTTTTTTTQQRRRAGLLKKSTLILEGPSRSHVISEMAQESLPSAEAWGACGI